MYKALLIVHILGAITWVGGGVFSTTTSRAALRTGEGLAAVARREAWAGTRLFGPAAGLTLLAGIGLVISSDVWAFGQTWVWLSLTLVAISFVVGGAFYGPTWKRMLDLDNDDPAGADLARLRSLVANVSVADLTMMVVVVVLMVTKPGA